MAVKIYYSVLGTLLEGSYPKQPSNLAVKFSIHSEVAGSDDSGGLFPSNRVNSDPALWENVDVFLRQFHVSSINLK